MTKKRNRYTRAFKLEVIHLVTQQNYKIREAAEAMGVGQSTLEGWLAQYRREQSGITPVGAKALTDEQKRTQDLEKQVKRLELEKEILKKSFGSTDIGQSENLPIIKKLNKDFALGIVGLCQLFGLPKSTYYHSLKPKKINASRVKDCKMTASMSRRGNCYDNSPTERFFRSLKTEWVPKQGYLTRVQAEADILQYITGYYRKIRPHQFNNQLTPEKKEQLFFENAA